MAKETGAIADIVLDAGIVFAQVGGRPLRLNVVRPREDAAMLRPAVIWVHGGGWREGRHTDGLEWWCCPALAAAGFVAVSVEYRLTEEAQFPAQIHDVKAAIRWVRANAVRFGADPDRIGLWGHSAGGHLVALAGLTADKPELEGDLGPAGVSSRVQAVVPASPPTDFSHQEFVLDPEASPFVVDLFGGTGPDQQELMRLASPVNHAAPDAPPFLVIHGAADELVPVEQGDRLVRALEVAGAPVTYERLEGADHGLAVGERPYPRAGGMELLGRLARDFFVAQLLPSEERGSHGREIAR
jgi:acetyl esterase/lipase